MTLTSMRISRIYCPQTLSESAVISLDQKTSHYLHKVLRIRIDQQLAVFDGSGNEFLASVIAIERKQLTIRLQESLPATPESSLCVSLGVGLSKGDRLDLIIQKSTELGVRHIFPLLTERAELKIKKERLQNKMDHWSQIIISACEQSGRSYLPVLKEPLTLADWVQSQHAELKFVLHHRSDQGLETLHKPDSVAILIGPEGGLSPVEISLAEKNSFRPLTLGPRILRTETAPIAALAIVQHLWGDM